MVAGCRLELTQGDITLERTDAIANAANSGLRGGGGVDGAIHHAAGPALLEACRAAKRTLPRGRLPAGEAVSTPGFALPARRVIHCVGPIHAKEGAAAPLLLARCYQNALRICRDQALESVAFPSISTGAYGYPVEEAATVALRAVRDELTRHGRPPLVRFVLFDARTFEAWRAVAERELPPAG